MKIDKIGIGIITCNRMDFFKNLIKSIQPYTNFHSVVVVNDGDPYPKDIYPQGIEIIQHTKNKCVGVSKNEALRYLIQQGCEHLFIIEDDMLIKDINVFETYIKTAAETGIWHLNFGYHGPANKKPDGSPNPRQIIEYKNNIKLALNPNCVGSFSYYYRGIIKNIGYIDERFKNAWDHVEHTYSIIKKGLHPPFWWFADVANSYDYIGDQDANLANSNIRKSDEWQRGMREGMEWYKYKHGWYPTQTPDTPVNNVVEILRNIKNTYSKEL